MSRSTLAALVALVALIALWEGAAQAAPEELTPDEIIALAETGVGFSYWWGGGCWTDEDGAAPGSCVGACPDCTHSGPWGADCSGFVGKVWQVPGPVALETCSHPYSTRSFRYQTYHWSPVAWGDVGRADAFVYRNSENTGGHVFLYESGDPWGDVWAFECRGCSDGCVHNLRSVSTAYIAIRRDNLGDDPAPPLDGTLQGVVFEDRGQGTADMTVRLTGAAVAVTDGAVAPTTAAGATAAWSFRLAPGRYTVRATAPDHAPAERTCEVTAGAATWCSVGLAPLCTADCAGRECGPDPVCGSDCGACAPGQVCGRDGRCGCTPDCGDRACGPDPVCGASCGVCPAGEACDAAGRCAGCTPDCGDRECGLDPVCGALSCGACPAGWTCGADGRCACTPDCLDRTCGRDPVCGTSCGACPSGQTCDPAEGRCTVPDPPDPCAAACDAVECGRESVCGAWCGRCATEQVCVGGACVPFPADTGKLYGRVTRGEDDALCPAVTVLHQGQPATETGPDGRYELLAQPGSHTVSAECDGAEGSATCTATAGRSTECDLVLATRADGDGLVFGADTVAPGADEGPAPATGGCAAGGAGPGLPALLVVLVVAGGAVRARRRTVREPR